MLFRKGGVLALQTKASIRQMTSLNSGYGS
jgi:hypothetical protein